MPTGEYQVSPEIGPARQESIRRRLKLPVAALLFAPASVLGYMSGNLHESSISDVIAALVGSVIFALLVWILVAAPRRHADDATAVITCVWVVVCLFYVSLFEGLNARMGGGRSLVATLPVSFVILILATLAIPRLRAFCGPVHTVLCGIALVMLATPLWSVAAYTARQGSAHRAYDADQAAQEMPEIGAANARVGRPPDIYHFIFDRFASEKTLEQHFGVQSSLGEYLRSRGFYVAADSHSNYLKTGHSLASTFYMDYLDLLSDDPRIEGNNWHPIFAMLNDHRVARFLKTRGYTFLQFGSWWVGTRDNAAADENHSFGLSEFNMLYLGLTILRPISDMLPEAPLTMQLDWDNAQCQRVARQVEQIKAVGARDKPVYVFAHILVPHEPYVFTPDGGCLTRAESIARGDIKGYVDQVGYASRIIEDVVTALLTEGRPRPIILIQSDEGPFPKRDYGIPWQDASSEELRIKTGILNAFYFPNGYYNELRPDITPINSYRTVFNAYFGTHFPQLPDRTFAFPNEAGLYEFHDVTDRIKNGGPDISADGARSEMPRDQRP